MGEIRVAQMQNKILYYKCLRRSGLYGAVVSIPNCGYDNPGSITSLVNIFLLEIIFKVAQINKVDNIIEYLQFVFNMYAQVYRKKCKLIWFICFELI